MPSFFGGNPNQAHFAVDVPDYLNIARRSEREAARAYDRSIMADNGFEPKVRYFRFRVGDNRAKALAKVNADRYAARVYEAVGVKMVVGEGCFL